MSRKIIYNLVFTIALIILCITYHINFGTALVHGTSMCPTLDEGDYLVIQKTNKVAQKDIVAIYSEELDEILIKRVIGVAGDHVVVDTSGVHINNAFISEDYILESDWIGNSSIDITVGDGELFVMGDNRNGSTDSRDLGCLKVSDIYGKCAFNLTSRLGLTRSKLFMCLIGLWGISIISLIIQGIKKEV